MIFHFRKGKMHRRRSFCTSTENNTNMCEIVSENKIKEAIMCILLCYTADLLIYASESLLFEWSQRVCEGLFVLFNQVYERFLVLLFM